MDYITKSVNREELRNYAKIFRYLFGINDDTLSFPVIEALERIPDVFEGTSVVIVEDDELPINIPARCYPDEVGNFTIEIKNSVYMGAYAKKIGAYLVHICHEMCHVFQYKIGYTPIMERSFNNNELPAYVSVEWQAKALCGEVMMPYEATKNMSTEEIVNKYGVSKSSAQYRKKY